MLRSQEKIVHGKIVSFEVAKERRIRKASCVHFKTTHDGTQKSVDERYLDDRSENLIF